MTEMDKTFGCNATTLLQKNVSAFFDFTWGKTMSVLAFVVSFHAHFDKISMLDMNGELKEHLLLRQTELDGYDRNIVIGSAGGDYSLQALSRVLRHAYHGQYLPASSMATSSRDHHRCVQEMPTTIPTDQQVQ